MKNYLYTYICISHVRNFTLALVALCGLTTSAIAQTKTESSTIQPMLLNAPSSEAESAKTSGKASGEQVLFHSKILLEKEKLYNNTRSYLAKYKCSNLVDATIKGMYVPANTQVLLCDISMPESFDKSTLPENVNSYRAELLKYIPAEALSELGFCFSYLGLQINDADLFTFYVAPYKLHIGVLKGTGLSGRELAWLIANDFKQSICEGNPQIYISKDDVQSVEKRLMK